MKKRPPHRLVLDDREKLLIALQMEDMVRNVNTVLKTRGVTFLLDYKTDMSKPALYIERPGVEPERIMTLDPRKRVSYVVMPRNKELHSFTVDLGDRLKKFEARLILVSEKGPVGPRRAKLQLYVDGATHIALTLMSVGRGGVLTDTQFTMPDGTLPT